MKLQLLQTLKFGQISTIVFTVICILIIVIESVYALPVLAFFLFTFQQPLFSDFERVIVAISCGIFLAAVYTVPFVFGLLIFCFLAGTSYIEWGKSRAEVRGAGVVLFSCGVLFFAQQQIFQLVAFLQFSLYFVVVLLGMRFWSRRRMNILHK